MNSYYNLIIYVPMHVHEFGVMGMNECMNNAIIYVHVFSLGMDKGTKALKKENTELQVCG